MMIYKTLNTDFTGIRLMGTGLFPVNWKVRVDIMISDETAMPEVGYQQMLYWLSALLDSVLIVNINDDEARKLAEQANNQLMTLPSDPFDDLIAHALIEKLSVIGAPKGLVVVGISLDADGVTNHIKDYDSSKSVLPDITYAGKAAKKKLKLPWWKRSTSETSDLIVAETEEGTINIHNSNVDILHRFGSEIEKKLYPSDDLPTDDAVGVLLEPEWNRKK